MTKSIRDISADDLKQIMDVICKKVNDELDKHGFNKTCFTLLIYEDDVDINISSNNKYIKDIIAVLEEATQDLYNELRKG